MKKLTVIILAVLLVVAVFVGCENKSTYQTTEVENVSISISNVSPTGATIIIKDSNEKPHTYGAWYQIEKKANGEWHEIETVIDNYGFDLVGYLPNNNGEIEFPIDWEWLYGELPPGNYRILKQVNSQIISVYFCVE